VTSLVTDEHEAIWEAVREFATVEIAPIRRVNDEPGIVNFPWRVFRAAADLDFLAPHYPAEYGGLGPDLPLVFVHE